MTSPINLESRVKGAITGVAVADALGGPVEFQFRGSFDKVTDYQTNLNFGLPPGAWTDDTSMTLCLAESFIKTRTFDITTQIQNYIAWYKRGYLSCIGRCFDIGNLTRQTLSFWHKHLGNSDATSGSQNEKASPDMKTLQGELNKRYKLEAYQGNGSLMRTVPIGLYFYSSPREKIVRYSHAASEVTHPYPSNGEACAVYSILVAAILSHAKEHDGETISKQALFDIFRSFDFEDEGLKARFAVYKSLKNLVEREEDAISSSGFVIHSLEAALWAFFSTNTWEDGCLKVVNLGDDADTVGAIYGGLAGSYYGLDDIPSKWRDNLVAKSIVGKIANDFYNAIVEKA